MLLLNTALVDKLLLLDLKVIKFHYFIEKNRDRGEQPSRTILLGMQDTQTSEFHNMQKN